MFCVLSIDTKEKQSFSAHLTLMMKNRTKVKSEFLWSWVELRLCLTKLSDTEVFYPFKGF